MNCDEAGRILSQEGVPARLPAEVQQHLNECSRCRQFSRALEPAGSDSPSAAQLEAIQKRLAADLLPVRPLAPAGYFLSALTVIFVCVVAIGVWWLGTAGLAAMSTLQASAILSALAVGAALLAYSLVQQIAPGSAHFMPPRPLPLGVMAVAALFIAVLFQFQRERIFWDGVWGCIRVGALLATLAAVPMWLVLRRGAILSPSLTGAAAGLLAGLAGTAALEIRCPNLDAWHRLAAHLGIAVLGAIFGFVAGLIRERSA